MTALSGLAQNYTHLLLARIGVGIGEAGGRPAGGTGLIAKKRFIESFGIFFVLKKYLGETHPGITIPLLITTAAKRFPAWLTQLSPGYPLPRIFLLDENQDRKKIRTGGNQTVRMASDRKTLGATWLRRGS